MENSETNVFFWSHVWNVVLSFLSVGHPPVGMHNCMNGMLSFQVTCVHNIYQQHRVNMPVA